MLTPAAWAEGLIRFLGEHGQDASIGVIGVGAADTLTEAAVEAFQIAGGPETGARPGGVLAFDLVVGDGAAKVAAEGGDGGGLGLAILAVDAPVAPQGRGVVLGLPDGGEVLENGPALAAALLGNSLTNRIPCDRVE